MNTQDFVITGFDSILYVKDKKGQIVSFESRYASCFIVTVCGRITFTSDSGCVSSYKGHPVFIPEGLAYVNECLEDAESYVFNFHTAKNAGEMTELSDVSLHAVEYCYEAIRSKLVSSSECAGLGIMKELYTLAELLLDKSSKLTLSEEIVANAVRYMAENFHDSSLNIRAVAESCFVSEIYLRKLFARHKGVTPFKLLTEIRMNRAKALAMSKRPVKEIAISVGYSDIYQFSRAYKKYFGYPPSEA